MLCWEFQKEPAMFPIQDLCFSYFVLACLAVSYTLLVQDHGAYDYQWKRRRLDFEAELWSRDATESLLQDSFADVSVG